MELGVFVETCTILGIEYDNVTVEQAAAAIYGRVCAGNGGYAVTPNAEMSEQCRVAPALAEAVWDADMRLPDGAGVVLASKICGRPLQARAAGFDTSVCLLGMLAQGGKSLYLLGAKPGTAQKAAENLRAGYPGLLIAGTHHGYFRKDEEVLPEIRAAHPDMLFVALGSPRQEIFMRRHRGELGAFMIGLGGSLDIFAGESKRAPALFIRLNLEWFYRLLREPWRIGRMMRLPRYVLRAFGWRLAHRGGNRTAAR